MRAVQPAGKVLQSCPKSGRFTKSSCCTSLEDVKSCCRLLFPLELCFAVNVTPCTGENFVFCFGKNKHKPPKKFFPSRNCMKSVKSGKSKAGKCLHGFALLPAAKEKPVT